MEGCGILANTEKKMYYNSKIWEKSLLCGRERLSLNAQCHGMSGHGILILLFQVCLLSFLLFQNEFKCISLVDMNLPFRIFFFKIFYMCRSIFMWKLSNLNIYGLKFSRELSKNSMGCLYCIIRLIPRKGNKDHIQLKQGKNSWTQPCIQEK